MKSGGILLRFTDREGREVILRTHKWEDLDGLTGLINSLVEEHADIEYDTQQTIDRYFLTTTFNTLLQSHSFDSS